MSNCAHDIEELQTSKRSGKPEAIGELLVSV
jgi:hypothetical protein